MSWSIYIKGFKSYLKLEKSFSDNTLEAYLRDVEKIASYVEATTQHSPLKVTFKEIQLFVESLNEVGISAKSQARIISGIKAFYKYLILENIIDSDPTELIESPKLPKKLPDTLSYDDIQNLIAAIDLSSSEGERNKAIIEVLYGCGLRVSELINLKISNSYLDVNFIRIIGKGNKERLVPIGDQAIKQINIYKDSVRNHMKIKPGNEDILFLNRRGAKLTRVMIFTIIKLLAKAANIHKKISPHTFRHSFATHLVEGGANLKAVQDMLGHESITTTEIYTHLDRSYLKDTINRYHPRS